MKKFGSAANMMMELCMQTCCMCMTFYMSVSDKFSISEVKHFAV